MQKLDKTLEYLTKGLLLAAFIIPPFIAPWVIGGKMAIGSDLFFPFVTGRVYIFRLLVEITLLFWLLLIVRKPEYRPRLKNPIILGTLLFLLGLIITAFAGVDPVHSFFSSIERSDGIVQFGHWLIFLLMITSVFRRPKDWKIFLWIFIGVAAALALYAWSLHSLPETNPYYEGRIAGLFNNPSYLAAFMLFAAGITGLLWAQFATRNNASGGVWRHILFGGLILFFIATLIQTGTRGSYLVGLVADLTVLSVLVFIFLRKTNRKLVFAVSGVFLLILLGVASIFIFKESNFVKNRETLNRIAVISELSNVGSVRERYANWLVATEAFKEKPIFGWGPENYDAAFNANYNYLAAKDESWYDSSHNQLLDVLTEGGIVGFSLYLFWIVTVFYVAFKLTRRNIRDKLLGAIIAATYAGFLAQGWFLFDTFPMYLGLFPLLGFAYFRYERANSGNQQTEQINKWNKPLPLTWIYALALILVLLTPYLIYKNVWQPYRANGLIFKFQSYLNGGGFKEAGGFLEQASKINSPYTNFDVGNQSAWSLLYVFDNPLPAESKNDAFELWKLVAAREEKSFGYRPVEQQVYYVLGRLYNHGYKQFGDPEYLVKAETYLRQGRAISPKRVEYVNELADSLLMQGRQAEAEALVMEHAQSIGPPYSYVFMGHLYFALQRYDLALAEYKKAESEGISLWDNDLQYSRYIFAGQQVGDYEAVLRLGEMYLANKKPDAEVLFNQAVAHYYLGNREEARRFYLKAVTLDRSYEPYASFFITAP